MAFNINNFLNAESKKEIKKRLETDQGKRKEIKTGTG